jgi:hypothetical protein
VEGIRIALDDYHHAEAVRGDILAALARASAGTKIKALTGVFQRISSGIPDERIADMADDIIKNVKGGNLIDVDSLKDALREAAARLAVPEVQEKVGRAMEETFASRMKALGRPAGAGEGTVESEPPDMVYELDLLRELAIRGVRVWENTLSPEGKVPDRQAPGDALKRVAERELLKDSVDQLNGAVYRLAAPHPLWAEVKTWEEKRRIFIQAVDQEKWIVGFLVFLVDVFIAFVVLLMLVLLVIEKTRDTGILLALGARPRGIVRIFLTEGLVVVAFGVVIGLVVGYFFIRNINTLHDGIHALTGLRLFDPEIYQMDRIPTTVTSAEVMLSIFPSVLFGFLASLIPAVWAAHQDPIKAIHYE